MRFYFYSILIFIILTIDVNAQHVNNHYAQFYNSPLTLNPSFTGKVNGDFRVIANYRNQFVNSEETPFYTTPAVSFDMPLSVGKHDDAIGLGVHFFNDRFIDGKIEDFNLMASFAYHKKINEKHSLSAGVQGGILRKRLDSWQLQWPSQFHGTEFDPDLMGENLEENYMTKFDINTGISWHGRFSDIFQSYAGFSIYHIHEPTEIFFDDSKAVVSRHFVLHGGVEYELTSFLSLTHSVVWMLHAANNEFNLAPAIFTFKPTELINFDVGAYYKIYGRNTNDAMVALIGVNLYNFRIGFSYEFNEIFRPQSDFNQVSGYPDFHIIELSLQFIGKVKPKSDVSVNLITPTF